MASAPTEFTPEITQDFYDKLARGITQRGAADVGLARSEALSRGLSGDAFESSGVNAARQGTNNSLNDLDANLNYNVAGLAREERLMGTQRGYQVEDRNFSANEAEKNRALSDRLARLGYANSQTLQSNQFGHEDSMLPYQLGAVGVGAALGRW